MESRQVLARLLTAGDEFYTYSLITGERVVAEVTKVTAGAFEFDNKTVIDYVTDEFRGQIRLAYYKKLEVLYR